MTASLPPPDGPIQAARRLGIRLLAIGRNRCELLSLELQEERARLMWALLVTVGIAVLALLCGITLTAAIAILCWDRSPGAVLLGMATVEAGGAWLLYRLLSRRLSAWTPMKASLEQLGQDQAALHRILS
jgi:uncharacterized membrane protein YqjE